MNKMACSKPVPNSRTDIHFKQFSPILNRGYVDRVIRVFVSCSYSYSYFFLYYIIFKVLYWFWHVFFIHTILTYLCIHIKLMLFTVSCCIFYCILIILFVSCNHDVSNIIGYRDMDKSLSFIYSAWAMNILRQRTRQSKTW